MVKCIAEAQNRPASFRKNAVRTLIIYPMNALVSDQLARFRKIMGGEEFFKIFTQDTHATRIPHFGMYTGRTSYAGVPKPGENKKLAEAYRERYLVDENASEEDQTGTPESQIGMEFEVLPALYKKPASTKEKM